MTTTNKKLNIAYWVVVALFGGFMTFSAIPDIMMDADAVKMIHNDMGYPMYFLKYIGVAKVLGGLAILIPGYPRIKEWAYAGLMFDLISAMYSFIALGLPVSQWIFMFIFIALGFTSYALYHKKYSSTAIG